MMTAPLLSMFVIPAAYFFIRRPRPQLARAVEHSARPGIESQK